MDRVWNLLPEMQCKGRGKKKKKDLKEKERTEKHRENKQTNEPKQLGFKNEPPQ